MAHLFFNTIQSNGVLKEILSNITDLRKEKHVILLDRLNSVRSSKDGEFTCCNDATTEQPSKTFPNAGKIGMCYSACETRHIGVGAKKSKMMCYCYKTSPKVERKTNCTLPCDGDKLCGGYGFVSIYEKVEEHVEGVGKNTCLAYYPRGYPGSSGAKWTNCDTKLRVACRDKDNVAISKGGWSRPYKSWNETMNYCFKDDEYPITKQLLSSEEYSNGRWTGQIRSRLVLADSQNPTGYVRRSSKSRSTFLLKFGASNQNGRPLCVKDPHHSITEFVTNVNKGSTSDQSSSFGFTDVDTYSVTDATPQSAVDYDRKETNGKGFGLDAVYITIPVLIIVVVIIALLFIRRRKRKVANARRDTEGYRQVSFRSNQNTRTVTNQAYSADGFHHAPEDSVQNTYHILEPTYEQVDVVDQRNDRNSQIASNDYHILEPSADAVESPGNLDGKPSSDVDHQLSPGSACGQVNVDQQTNDRHPKEASRDYHILEPTYEQPDVIESREHLKGTPSIKVNVVRQLASESSYEQVDVCADAKEQPGERIVPGGSHKRDPVRNNVNPFDIYNHSSTTGVDDYDTTASVIGKRQTKFPVTDDVYNRLGDGDTYNVLKKY